MESKVFTAPKKPGQKGAITTPKCARPFATVGGDQLYTEWKPRLMEYTQTVSIRWHIQLIGEAMIHGLCGSPNTDQSLWSLASNVKCSLDNHHGPVHASLYITSMYIDVGIAVCTSLVASIVMQRSLLQTLIPKSKFPPRTRIDRCPSVHVLASR